MDRKVSVTVNQPSVPQGEQVDVPGLGLFKNGVPRSVTDEDMITFNAVHLAAQRLPADLVEVDEDAYQTGRGQTLARAFAGSPHLSVVEEDAEPISVSDAEEDAPKKAKPRTVKSSAPVGEDKGTGAKSEEE